MLGRAGPGQRQTTSPQILLQRSQMGTWPLLPGKNSAQSFQAELVSPPNKVA